MDPFCITGPATISFSGGRTSAYMLWRILQAHGGALPPDVYAVFANTGREMSQTLDFVQRCSSEWAVPVVWLEFTARRPDGYAIVSHNSASRDGAPFAAAIAAKKALPNPLQRWCTEELKIRTISRWAKHALGWRTWQNVIGIRADEAHRLRDQVAPLLVAGVTKADVMAFWAAQPFDLGLRGPWEGNCDGCFLKSRAAIERMHADYPARMAWWRQQEAARTFRNDREPYSVMAANVAASPRLFPDALLAEVEGCGVMCGV